MSYGLHTHTEVIPDRFVFQSVILSGAYITHFYSQTSGQTPKSISGPGKPNSWKVT